MAQRQEGIVIAVDGTLAKVKTSRHNSCDSCGACPGNSAMVLDAVNMVGAQPGQRVEIEVKEASMLKAAFTVFVLPLAASFAGVWGGAFGAEQWGWPIEWCQLGGGLVAFLLSLLYIKYFDTRAGSDRRSNPIITRICS